MNTAFYVSLVLLTIACAFVIVRIAVGPSDPDRAVAADLLLASFVGVLVLFSLLGGYSSIPDVIIIAATAGFLSTLALARLILRDEQ